MDSDLEVAMETQVWVHMDATNLPPQVINNWASFI